MQEGNGSVAVLIPLGVRLQLYARNSYTAFLLVQQAHVLVANLLVLLDSLVASLLATFICQFRIHRHRRVGRTKLHEYR
jgi:hypothetical protein